MPADIPKYALRPHSFEQLAHPVQHIADARRAPALLYVVCSVPRFIARTVLLDESRLVFRRCLASDANIRKNSLTTTRVGVCFEQSSDDPPTPDDASRIQNIHKTPTQLPTYNITLAAPVSHPQHPMTLAACNTATRHVPPALALAP